MDGKANNRRRIMWKGTMSADEIGNLSCQCLDDFLDIAMRQYRVIAVPIRTILCMITSVAWRKTGSRRKILLPFSSIWSPPTRRGNGGEGRGKIF